MKAAERPHKTLLGHCGVGTGGYFEFYAYLHGSSSGALDLSMDWQGTFDFDARGVTCTMRVLDAKTRAVAAMAMPGYDATSGQFLATGIITAEQAEALLDARGGLVVQANITRA